MPVKRSDQVKVCPCGAEFKPWIKAGGVLSEFCGLECKKNYGPWRRRRRPVVSPSMPDTGTAS